MSLFYNSVNENNLIPIESDFLSGWKNYQKLTKTIHIMNYNFSQDNTHFNLKEYAIIAVEYMIKD